MTNNAIDRWELSWPSVLEGHVIPIDDLHPHQQDAFCGCKPRIEYEGRVALVIHHSYDRRELAEQPQPAA